MSRTLDLNPVVEVEAGDGRVLRLSGLLPLKVPGGRAPAWRLRAGTQVRVGGRWLSVLRVVPTSAKRTGTGPTGQVAPTQGVQP